MTVAMRTILWFAALQYIVPASAKMEIGEDTMWTDNKSLTGQVVILPGKTLRIKGNSPPEPVVIDLHEEAKDVGGFKISPGAKLELENVVLTRSKQDEDFAAISFVDETQAVVIMTHVRCEKMSTCVVRFCCGGNEAYIQDSIFYKNKVALAGNGRMDSVKRSLFVENELALTNADWDVEDSVFLRNQQASNAANSRFVRTIFLENNQTVSDPGGNPNPFLSDVLFYRNRQAILPALDKEAKAHASIERASFIENQSPIYSTSKLPPLQDVNFINSTEFDLVYAGTSSAEVSGDIYWGKDSTAASIRGQIYDGFSGSKGGVIMVKQFAAEPFLHDIIIGILKYNPSPLLGGLEKYFSDWETRAPPHGTRTAFDFGKLREWSLTDVDEIVLEPPKAEDAPEPVVEVQDSETNGVVEIPQDVIAEQATSPPAPEGDTPSGVEEKTNNAQESIDEHHETKQHEQEKAQVDMSTASAAKLIHTYDEEGTILFVSLVLNTCLLWVMSVLAFDYFFRGGSLTAGRYSRVSTEERNDNEGDNDENDENDDHVYKDTVEDDAAYAAKRPGKVHVV